MLDLECRNCGFKFRKVKIPPRCPYCSKEGKVGFSKTAQDLLDETLGETSIMDQDRKRRNI
jgi:predicted Zn-ribbon and HTH transcriptional regulator